LAYTVAVADGFIDRLSPGLNIRPSQHSIPSQKKHSGGRAYDNDIPWVQFCRLALHFPCLPCLTMPSNMHMPTPSATFCTCIPSPSSPPPPRIYLCHMLCTHPARFYMAPPMANAGRHAAVLGGTWGRSRRFKPLLPRHIAGDWRWRPSCPQLFGRAAAGLSVRPHGGRRGRTALYLPHWVWFHAAYACTSFKTDAFR